MRERALVCATGEDERAAMIENMLHASSLCCGGSG